MSVKTTGNNVIFTDLCEIPELPKEVGTAPSPTEYQKHLENSLGHDGILGDGAVKGQELDSIIILVGPFQLWIFCDAVTFKSLKNCIVCKLKRIFLHSALEIHKYIYIYP